MNTLLIHRKDISFPKKKCFFDPKEMIPKTSLPKVLEGFSICLLHSSDKHLLSENDMDRLAKSKLWVIEFSIHFGTTAMTFSKEKKHISIRFDEMAERWDDFCTRWPPQDVKDEDRERQAIHFLLQFDPEIEERLENAFDLFH